MSKLIMRSLITIVALLTVACSTLDERGDSRGGTGAPGISVEQPAANGISSSETASSDKDGSGVETFAVSSGKIDGKPVAGVSLDRDPLQDPESPLATRTFYFEFDRSTIREEDRPVLLAHANYLAMHPETHVTLFGYTDERGSREYNLALGEQRAKSVADLMRLQGVPDSQFDIVSFGEERPASPGHDEAAWQQNRRVEIVY